MNSRERGHSSLRRARSPYSGAPQFGRETPTRILNQTESSTFRGTPHLATMVLRNLVSLRKKGRERGKKEKLIRGKFREVRPHALSTPWRSVARAGKGGLRVSLPDLSKEEGGTGKEKGPKLIRKVPLTHFARRSAAPEAVGGPGRHKSSTPGKRKDRRQKKRNGAQTSHVLTLLSSLGTQDGRARRVKRRNRSRDVTNTLRRAKKKGRTRKKKRSRARKKGGKTKFQISP